MDLEPKLTTLKWLRNVDDGIEFFGGTVNAYKSFGWGQGDDAIDIDQAYAGTIDGALVILTDASDHGFEIDGPEGSASGSFTLKNATVLGATNDAVLWELMEKWLILEKQLQEICQIFYLKILPEAKMLS